MSFLGQLSDQINSQFSLGENSTHTLDGVIDGSNVKHGSLGDFSKNVDKSAERRYVEEGYLRRDPYNATPKQFEILMQEPNATVLVKKRMFSSTADNFRPDFMDNDEKLYYKATRILFQNKCNQIAALEKLSKIQKITAAVGQVSDQLIPIIITLADQLNYGSSLVPFSSGLFGQVPDSNPFGTKQISSFTSVVDKLRKVYVFNQSNAYTTWITDPSDLFQSTLGQGTGVIEITNFTNLTTSTTVEMESGGSFGLTISDPYGAMVISDYDIEIALSDATNLFYNHKIFQFGTQAANNVIQGLQQQLTQARSARNASPLTVQVDPNTLLSKRVRVIIDRLGIELIFTYNANGSLGFPGLGGSGGSVQVDPSYLKGGAIAGYDGLSTQPNTLMGPDRNINSLSPQSELSLFQSLIAAIFNQLQMQANSQNSFQTSNTLTNYARRKMRFNFLSELIIQPMDTVHIYMVSKSRYDNKVLSGLNNLLSGAGVLQNLNNTVTDFKNTFDALFRPSGNIPLQLEKSVYVGPEFPNYLWSLMRTQFVTEKEGTHVFAGVVDNATEGWTEGKFTVDVRGKDNSVYFEQGKVNFKPGVDVFNGSWFDPMTPFKSNFDQISSDAKNNTSELLDQNKDILTSGVKFKLGPFAGTQATASNYLQDRSIDPQNGLVNKIFYAPDGLVYKWREGIGVFTQAGLSNQINDPNRVGNPNLFREPFAGQDIMNVLSLLITGTPYNFTTFYKAVLGNGNFGVDPQSNQAANFAFINSVTSQITKNNTLWGNFIPFKSLTMDEATYAKSQFNQFTITQYNNELDNKIQQYQTLLKQSALYTAIKDYAPNLNTTDPNFTDVTTQITNLKADINTTVQNINAQNKTYYQQAGNDPTFDYNSFIDSGGGDIGGAASGGTNAIVDPQVRKNLRRQINYLTRRMSYDVRFNVDKNLFIVDDYYDKDFDILAYASALTDGVKIWNNEFTSVKEKIIQTAKLLNLEVFCDTQGHIRVRSPQYNRMPSSVFYRMMYLKQALNVQVFPEYLNSLFTDQLQGLKSQVEVLEDEIRLDCAILGANTDDDAVAFIQTGATSNTGTSFLFLSDSSSGEITDINSLVQQANPDVVQSQVLHGISDYQNVKEQSGNKQVFSNSQRFTAIDQLITKQKQGQSGYNTSSNVNSVASDTYVNILIERIFSKSGQRLAVTDFIQTNDVGVQFVSIPANQSIDIFKTTRDLQSKISARQRMLKLFYGALKNAAELKSLDDSTTVSNQLLTPGSFGNSHVPEVFEHMIEDETYDDYGPGSGSRYIIRRPQIKSWNLAANAPPYTTVEVQGILNPFQSDPSNLPTALNFFPGSGNGMVTAMAIDYDMWRSYGFKGQATVQVPFLSDPIKQCGPYAAMLLSLARKNILRGSITISGNEFMQPGEVVYLEDRGLLFYVTSVRHNLTLASGFTTTLELTYGHPPGEYIPTTMDFIGKLIYKNGNDGTVIVQRQDNSGNETSIGALQLGSNANVSDNASSDALNTGGANQTPNPTSDFNSQVINNILFMAAYMTNANAADNNNVVATIEVRTYFGNDTSAVGSDLSDFADQVVAVLTGSSDGPKNFPGITNTTNTALASSVVTAVAVNLDDKSDRRSPSQKAWDAARNQSNSSSFGSGNGIPGFAVRQALFSYIVDCWIVVKPDPTKTQTSNGS